MRSLNVCLLSLGVFVSMLCSAKEYHVSIKGDDLQFIT